MRQMRSRVVILSGELGDGHKQAAHALVEASALYEDHVDVQVVDFMSLVSPRLHHVSKYLFVQGLKNFPYVYGFLYKRTRQPNALSYMLKRCTAYGISRLLHFLNETRPDIVVSTFPMAAAAVSLLKESGAIHMPSVTVVTDHTDHSYWLHHSTDHYIVGSEFVRHSLARSGIADHRMSVTGIPIRSQFYQSFNRQLLRKKHGLLLDRPTLLLMGGGHGMMSHDLINMLKSEQLADPLQIIIVCGHNDSLRRQLSHTLHGSKHHIVLTGYVDYVHELMALSDLIITKPGGLTTSEAIALNLPMLLYRPLPGQEQDNARCLVKMGVAVMAKHETDLLQQLKMLLAEPHILGNMRENAAHYAEDQSALKAWEAIMQVNSQGRHAVSYPKRTINRSTYRHAQ